MSAQTVVPEVWDLDRPRTPWGLPAGAADRLWQQYRLVVIAPTTAEAVESAGGWTTDRALIGFEAVVITVEPPDPVPLRVVGAGAEHLPRALAAPARWLPAQEIAVHAPLYHARPRIRRLLEHAMETWDSDVRLWGEPGAPIRHEPSIAARAFKSHALKIARPAAADTPATAVESFRAVTRRIGVRGH